MSKKNLRRIPKNILLKISKFEERYFVAGCLKTYSKEDIEKWKLRHLSIEFEQDKLKVPSSIIPDSTRGKYSKRNINGYESKRKDLPKEQYTITIESPNWGDSSNGTHDVTWTKERYRKDFIAPRLSRIKTECFDTSSDLDKYTFKFEISEILDKESEDFEERLLECLNILQENVSKCDVFKSGSTFQDYMKTLQLSWEILPPGTKEETIERIFRRSQPTKKEIETASDRYDFFSKLNPSKFVYGKGSFQRYFGALIKEDLVVFENITYGNAIYVMYENWKELSKKSRIELLSGRYGDNFDRIIHRRGWKSKVRKIIKKQLEKK